MSEPSEEQVKAAQEMTQQYRKQIDGCPPLLSLLYDIDLLPEQIRLPVNAVRMSAVCEIFKVLTAEQIASLFRTNRADQSSPRSVQEGK
jgi:hypothetical protein